MIEADRVHTPPLVVICGPTASGKTDLALRLAEDVPLEVISADSRQVYRAMDIGTAKPTREERVRVPHHLVDVVDPDQDFSVADFVRLGRAAATDIHRRGRLPLVAGGTGLYLQGLTAGLVEAPAGSPELRREFALREEREGAGTLHALLAGCDPESAQRLPESDTVRIIRALEVFELTGRPLSDWQKEHAFRDRPYRVLQIGLSPPREELYARIDRRTRRMFEMGIVEETRALLARGYDPALKSLRTLGYRECQQYLAGESDLETCIEHVQMQTRRYAKRQLTWFRRDDAIIWFESLRDFDKITKLINVFLMK